MTKYKKYPVKDWLDFTIGYECRQKEIRIEKCDKAMADVIIIKYHYSHKPTQNSFMSFLVYYKNKVSGALQLGYGIRPHIKGQYDFAVTREFDRMWLSDEMPKYSETIVISLLIHFLKVMTDIRYLISYADTTVGNKGTIYKASNARMIDKIRADFYILPDGERVHLVSMYHRHKSRAWNLLQKLYPGIKKADGYQLKFLYEL